MAPAAGRLTVVASTRAPRGARSPGFTLLELLAVVGLLSVLMGLGIGFLRRGGGDLQTALNSLRAVFREAANTARSAGMPAQVLLRDRGDGPHEAVSLGLIPVGAWRMDDRGPERVLAPDLRPSVLGEVVPTGRFGEARRGTDELPAWELQAATGRFAMANGFGLRGHFKLDERRACTVLRMGSGVQLRMDPGGRLEARIVLAGVGGERGDVYRGISGRALPVGRWLQLEVVHDGRRFQVLVDGVPEIDLRAEGRWFRDPDQPFVISPTNDPMPAAVDELELLAYAEGQPVILPEGVAFARRGREASGGAGRESQPITPSGSGDAAPDKVRVQRLQLDRNGDPEPGASLLLDVYDPGVTAPEPVRVVVQPGGLLSIVPEQTVGSGRGASAPGEGSER